uniref:Membrane-bound transcription factor site-2 protease n=1 Tax=Daphnia pulicaria TaxID=35523 RepID=A0A4Y7MY94_9CRUS|nr:EOG090X08FA [Daphnia pulicaria]
MDVTTVLGSVILLHTFFYYLDRYLKGKNSQRYSSFLNRFPVQIDFMNVRWTTSMFNKALCSWAMMRLKFLSKWYNVGTVITLLLCIPSLILLGSTALVSFENMMTNKKEEAMLQPVVPGVNLPSYDLPYYLITLLVCTVVHEAGHAIAAVSDQVPLVSIGLILWLIIPAAFVELPTSNVVGLSPWKQLKIYCAGVWHNIVLSAMAFAVLMMLPILLIPLFQSGAGVSVVNLNAYSTDGHHDFQVGDQLTQINDCHVTGVESWRLCLTAVLLESSGFCLDNSYLASSSSSDQLGCCNDSELSRSHLCFLSSPNFVPKKYHCLRAREVSQLSSAWCSNHKGCSSVNQSCLMPSFHSESVNETDSSRLIIVKRKSADPVLFAGLPNEIYLSVYVSDYVPRIFIGPQFINFIEHLLRYISSFSAGLAVLNVVPCIFMDGHHIVGALSEIAFEGRGSISMKRQTQYALVFLGTSLVVINIAFGVLTLFL